MALGSGRTLGATEEVALSDNRCGVAISWDHGGKDVDVDLQAAIVNDKGAVTDAVYYNNMKAGKYMTHSGDEQTGEKEGLDEIIWINFSKMPAQVQMVIFVVAAHSGGHLCDVSNGVIHLLGESKETEIGRISMERSSEDVDVVAAIVRSSSNSPWKFVVVDVPAQKGSHFMDILEPSMGNLIRTYIQGAPKRIKAAFSMDKGAVFDLPESPDMKNVTAGLGWDVAGGASIDLDVSAVLFDAGGQQKNIIYYGKLKGDGLEHTGDNLTGEGDGDDEQIRIDLSRVPSLVTQIIITVNIYTSGATFSKVSNPYCRIFDQANNEMARYTLQGGGREIGLAVARLFRDQGDRWAFQAIGKYIRGRTASDCIQELTSIHRMSPRELQLRGTSMDSLPTPEGAPSRPKKRDSLPTPEGAPSRPKKRKKDCNVQ